MHTEKKRKAKIKTHSHNVLISNVTEDIPSDAEAEARSRCIDEVVTLPVDNGKAESQGHVFNTGNHNLITIT